MRPLLLGMRMLALPDVAGEVAEDAGEVVVAAATGRGGLAKLAAADDATESLMLGIPRKRSAAPKRDTIVFGQTT